MNVVILAAGSGTRVLELTPSKPMLMVNGLPMVKHMMDKYRKYPTFVTVRQDDLYLLGYLTSIISTGEYPLLKLCQLVEPTEGPMVSLHKTAEAFPELLDSPVVVTVCDGLYTILESTLESAGNLVGTSRVLSPSYLRLDKDPQVVSWIGVVKISRPDREQFSLHKNFDHMLTSKHWPSVDVPDWADFGTKESYCKHYDDTFDMSKKDSSTEIVGKRVIKTFAANDKAVLFKSRLATNVYCTVDSKLMGNTVTYDYVEGKEFYNTDNPAGNLERLLDHFWEKLWKCKYKPLDMSVFYKEKTLSRAAKYGSLNVFKDFDWSSLTDGLAANIHGDLHYGNIIKNGHTVSLIDWRTDFEPFVDIEARGDIYYDLAKLMSGMLVDLAKARTGMFKPVNSLNDHLSVFRGFHTARNLDWNKTKILCSLILMSIAPLHKKPFDAHAFNTGIRLFNNPRVYGL